MDTVTDSILLTIKRMIGYDDDYDVFDHDLIIHINGLIARLNQVGPTLAEDFYLEDSTATWDDYFSKLAHPSTGDWFTKTNLQIIKDYIYVETKIVFDPPTSSFVLEALKEQGKEMEWRISCFADKK